MYHYRISKYNPIFRREDGSYWKNEWTDYSCIGSSFDGAVLSRAEYLSTEDKYTSCISDIMSRAGVEKLRIKDLEKGDTKIWKNGRYLCGDRLKCMCRSCLRSQCWCRLIGKKFYLHFGYEFYIYIGCTLCPEIVSLICEQRGLFCDIIKESPYSRS